MLVAIGAAGIGRGSRLRRRHRRLHLRRVAGEMFQDLKVGHIFGGTPAKMEGATSWESSSLVP